MSQSRHYPPLSRAKSGGASASPSPRSAVDDNALCQEYHSYLVQLRGLLEETTGQPPLEVNNAEVEHRIALIQSALDEVERRNAEARWRIELRQNKRFLDTYARRIQAEEEAEQKRQSAETQRLAQVEEARSAQVDYYRNRNDRTDAKARQCRTQNAKAQVEAVERASSNEERRVRNLTNLAAERQRKQKELHDREAAKQEYARQVRDRRAKQAAQEQEEKARQALIHCQEMEGKLAAIREAKRNTRSARRAASRAKSEVAWENGETILEAAQRDHGRLMEDLHQRQKQQVERYLENKAEQEAYLRQRAQHRLTRQERQQESLRRLIDQRVSHGTQIVKEADAKREKAERAKERQAAQYAEAARELDEDILRHQQRAQQLQDEHYNTALRQNYRRWNHRAARIMEELRGALKDADEQDAPHGNAAQLKWGGGRADHRDAPPADAYGDSGEGHRALSIPLPEDFAV